MQLYNLPRTCLFKTIWMAQPTAKTLSTLGNNLSIDGVFNSYTQNFLRTSTPTNSEENTNLWEKFVQTWISTPNTSGRGYGLAPVGWSAAAEASCRWEFGRGLDVDRTALWWWKRDGIAIAQEHHFDAWNAISTTTAVEIGSLGLRERKGARCTEFDGI